MGLSGCYSCIKYLVVFLNFIFFLIGLATVVLAIWMLVDPTFYISMAQDHSNYLISTYILLVAGLLLLIVSFLGCCGAFQESPCMLISFFSLLLIILVAEIAAGAWAYNNADSLEALVRSYVKNTIEVEYHSVENRRSTFDAIQKGLKCCGIDRPSDWGASKKAVLTVDATIDSIVYKIPESCCRLEVDILNCTHATNMKRGDKIKEDVLYTDGCFPKIVNTIKQNAGIFLAITITAVVIEFIGIILALVLAFAVNRSKRYKA